ncbi:hypothetical protein [Sporanaerobium hydrogeniformans]|nr:hypothetical protein [Sporanaerobium hydrogeniformans]
MLRKVLGTLMSTVMISMLLVGCGGSTAQEKTTGGEVAKETVAEKKG